MVHWADVTAEELLHRRGGRRQVFATAITPSGPIHVGNMREVLTSDAVYRATRERGEEADFLYIADDFDPLRKVYPFLHEDYAEHVGRPLVAIPCPDDQGRPIGCGDHTSYAEHFLSPFLDALDRLGMHPTVLSAHAMYQEGRYADTIRTAIGRTDELRALIERISKRQLPKAWLPFNPRCPDCGRIGGVEVLGVDGTNVDAECPCGHAFTVDAIAPGAGKLPWRIDWPARWTFLGVTFEASGKDHHAAGGSWQTGQAICQEIFETEPPFGIMYEFLNLKGKGAMHSSSGLAVSATDMLGMTPPVVLRYLMMRQSPRKAIDFDPGLGLLNLVDEFDRMERVRFGADDDTGAFTEVERTYALSCPRDVPDRLPEKVDFRHLVTVVQLADDLDGVERVLHRSGELKDALADADRALLVERVDHARTWLERFAPDDIRFTVQQTLPEHAYGEDDRSFLAALADALQGVQWTGQAIHEAVYAAKGERPPGQAFKALYQAILGQDRGPRAGFFLASLERDWVVRRLREAATT